MKPWPFWEVSVTGFPPHVMQARSRGAAFADAFRSYSECRDITFRDFLRIATVRPGSAPANDGYEYIRRAYDTDPKIGQRVTLRNEGCAPDRCGTVIYPNRSSTSYVHVVLDGDKHSVVVHPLNVVPLERADA